MSVPFEYWYQAEVISVHDGDTMTLSIDMGRRIYAIDSIRLLGINCPELSQPGGKEAREFVRNLCPPGKRIRIRTMKNKNDKYGRWLGIVYFEDGNCLNDTILAAGHAVETVY